MNVEGPGYYQFHHTIRNYLAVTGAMLALRKRTFNAVRGFDESFPIDFNDVDFCLRVRELGQRIVFTPFATLRHFESRSALRIASDSVDRERFRRKWETLVMRDPYYNRNLSRDSQYCEPLQA
jgi:GT2 family glycosyltransferase